MIYVFWHQNPDTDSYCSAVAYASFLQDMWQPATPVALWTPNAETAFIFSKFAVSLPPYIETLPAWTQIVLVDHNEAWQSISQRDQLDILAVFDHHKIAWFETTGPVMMRCDVVWCTATILLEYMQEQWWTPPKHIAWLMLAAIISDTLLFTSPTTTDRDRAAADFLAQQAEIDDMNVFAQQMFDAKSDLSGMNPDEIITMDYKEFTAWAKTFAWWVIETTNPSFALDQKEDLLAAMRHRQETTWLDYIFVSIVDIFQSTNTTLVLSDDEAALLAEVFGVTTDNQLADLWSRISRKKEMIPQMSAQLQRE